MIGFQPQARVAGISPVVSGDFTTSFPATENPISQSSIWLNGLADGLDWKNVATTNATDGISRAVGSQFVSGFDDPTAILKISFRTFHNDQFVQGTIYRQSGYIPTGTYHETELRLRSALSAHSCTGYEVLFALNDPAVKTDGYAIVRWNGVLGDFTTILNSDGGIVPVISDGDVFRVELRGSTMKVFRNGSQLGSDVDVTVGGSLGLFASGQPGIGMYPQTPGGTVDAFGWRSFTAGDLA